MKMMLIFLAATAAAAGTPAVRIESRGAFQAVVRDVRGDYAQHGTVARDLLAAVRAACPGRGVLFGTYPQDPDAVPRDQLHWRLGYGLPRGRRCAVRSIAGYALVDQPSETDAILDTTLGTSREEGLAMLSWLGTSGYVQVGPTRMEYLDFSADPSTRVRIVVPVRRRTWTGPVRDMSRRP